jgi:hypothetical protein
VHEEQDAGQILPGAPGSAEALAAPGVLPPEASATDPQVPPPSACESRPPLELSRGGGLCVCGLSLGGKCQNKL